MAGGISAVMNELSKKNFIKFGRYDRSNKKLSEVIEDAEKWAIKS